MPGCTISRLSRLPSGSAGALAGGRAAPSLALLTLASPAGFDLRALAPPALVGRSFFGLEPWQWIGLAASVAVAGLLAWLVAAIAAAVFRSLARRTAMDLDDALVELLHAPARLFLGALVFRTASAFLVLEGTAARLVTEAVMAVAAAAVAWSILRLVDLAASVATQRLQASGQSSLGSAVPLGRRIAKGVVLAFSAVVILQNAGFNAAGLLAGLGIGGIALALAAQKTIEDLFGGVTLVTAQPVRVGEVCRFGDKLGTVEDIGLRTTRIRTPERTLVTVPNGSLASSAIENLTARDRILFSTTLGLRYETSADQLRVVLAGLRRLLLSHAMVDPVPARVRLSGFGASSLDVLVFAYVKTRDFNEFLAVQEDLLLRIMDVVEQAGSGFAFPSRTVYFGRDPGPDGERAGQAEQEMQRLREAGRVPLPDVSIEEAAGLAGSIRWPPEGSAQDGAARD